MAWCCKAGGDLVSTMRTRELKVEATAWYCENVHVVKMCM